MVREDAVRRILLQAKDTPSEELESECLEVKGYKTAKSLNNSKDLAEEVVAFANHTGAVIVIGVRDRSEIAHCRWAEQLVGSQQCDELEIRARLNGRIGPELSLKVVWIEFEDRCYLAIDIPRRRDTLVATTSAKVYVRDGRSSRPMSPAEIE